MYSVEEVEFCDRFMEFIFDILIVVCNVFGFIGEICKGVSMVSEFRMEGVDLYLVDMVFMNSEGSMKNWM